MKEVRLLAFAHAKDVLGFAEKVLSIVPEESPRRVLERVCGVTELGQWRVAVDCEYSDWDKPVGTGAEMAIIPPVSGG